MNPLHTCTQIYFLLIRTGFSMCTHVTIMPIVIGENPMSGLHTSGPMYDMSFAMAKEKYPDIFRNITIDVIYRARPVAQSGCGDTGDLIDWVAGEAFQKIQHVNGFPVILSPGCSLEIIALGDYARELNVPLLTSTSADASLDNRKRYPTLTTFSSAGQGHAAVSMRTFMRLHKWRVVTVLCDDLSLLPGAATYYIVDCKSVKTLLTVNVGEFQLYYESFDSFKKPDYTGMLQRAKEHSRIISFGTNANIVRRFMVEAHRLEMTNGDYVFLYPESCAVPQTTLLALDQNDGLDEDVLAQAFQSVVLFRFPFPDWARLNSFTDSVAERAKTVYNYTFAADDYRNDITLCILEVVLVLSQVLQETWSFLDQLDGRAVSDRIVGRSFDLGFRTVNIGPNGMRYRDVLILRLNSTTRHFETAWMHHWTTNSVSVESNQLAYNWFGSPTLPPDVPLCGFHNELCPFSSKSSSNLLVIVLCGVCVLVILGLSIWFHAIHRRSDLSTWWDLETDRLSSIQENQARLVQRMEYQYHHYRSGNMTT